MLKSHSRKLDFAMRTAEKTPTARTSKPAAASRCERVIRGQTIRAPTTRQTQVIVAQPPSAVIGCEDHHSRGRLCHTSMLISIVIPLLNEEANLAELHRRLTETLDRIGCERRIIFVDDGSTDRSPQIIRQLAGRDPDVIGIRLSRNFGHERASTAGLDHALGDAAVLMDADLQDPPEMIEKLVAAWKEGAEIVY